MSSPGPPALVVVGASAGGVEALSAFVAGLPAGLPAAVLVVLHVPARAPSRLPAVLARAGRLPVRPAVDGEPVLPGTVVVAPADRHLLVHEGAVLLGAGARENGWRPAVDPLFRSAARWAGPRVAAVVLSGVLDDGAAGAAWVAARGGAVLVQDLDEAMFDGMPRAALRAVPDARVAPVAQLGAALAGLLAERAALPVPPPGADLTRETDMAELEERAVSGVQAPGRRVPVSCPDCHGAMSELRVGGAVTYRCHVGHGYGPASLLQAQEHVAESALWTAVASLEEQAAVHRELAEGDGAEAQAHRAQAEQAGGRARELRRQLRRTVRAG